MATFKRKTTETFELFQDVKFKKGHFLFGKSGYISYITKKNGVTMYAVSENKSHLGRKINEADKKKSSASSSQFTDTDLI